MVLSQIKKDKNILLKLKKNESEAKIDKNIISKYIGQCSKVDNNDCYSLYIKNEDENLEELAPDEPATNSIWLYRSKN